MSQGRGQAALQVLNNVFNLLNADREANEVCLLYTSDAADE